MSKWDFGLGDLSDREDWTRKAPDAMFAEWVQDLAEYEAASGRLNQIVARPRVRLVVWTERQWLHLAFMRYLVAQGKYAALGD